MAKAILYFQHRRTGDCQNVEKGSQIEKMLSKSPKKWGQIKDEGQDKALTRYKRALAGERVVNSRYVKPAAK